jgi:hypothetical protein
MLKFVGRFKIRKIIAKARERKEKERIMSGSVLNSYVHHFEWPIWLYCAHRLNYLQYIVWRLISLRYGDKDVFICIFTHFLTITHFKVVMIMNPSKFWRESIHAYNYKLQTHEIKYNNNQNTQDYHALSIYIYIYVCVQRN